MISRKEFRKAAEYLRKNYRDTDFVLHTSSTSSLPFVYYLDPRKNRELPDGGAVFQFLEDVFQSLGNENRLFFQDVRNGRFGFYKRKDDFTAQSRDDGLAPYKRIWLVYSYWEVPVPFEGLKNWFDARYALLESREFMGVRLFLYETGGQHARYSPPEQADFGEKKSKIENVVD